MSTNPNENQVENEVPVEIAEENLDQISGGIAVPPPPPKGGGGAGGFH